MITLLTIVHVIVCVFLIAIVLLQHGKGADMGAAFGGGSSQTVFGTDGPLPLLNKITTGSAILFMITSIALAYHSANISQGSVMSKLRVAPPVEQPTELVPAPGPVEVPMPSGPTSGEALPLERSDVPAQFPGEAAAPAQFPGEASSTDDASSAEQTAPATEEQAAPAATDGETSQQ